MKFLRILLLPLLSVLLVSENQALGKRYSSYFGASSIGKSSEKTDTRVSNLNKQGGRVSAKTPVGKRGHKTGADTGREQPELLLKAKNTDAVIEGRKFTGHALDQMQSRGIISPKAVSDVIKNPTKVIPGKRPGTQVYFKDNLKVIANENGDVITVYWN